MWHLLIKQRCIRGLGEETCRKKHLEDRRVDGKIMISWIERKWEDGHGLD